MRSRDTWRVHPGGAGRALLALAVALLPVASAAAGLPKTGFLETNGTVRVGGPAPAIAGEDLSGARVSGESLGGRPILLDFGSIFCGSCQETMREFRRLQEVYKGTDLALVVVVDGAAPVETLRNFFRSQGARYTVIRDGDGSLARAWGVTVIPFQVAIGRDGRIRKIHVGFNPEMETALGLPELAGK